MEVETIKTRSVAETQAWGRSFAERLGPGDCVALIGPLGAGKTALVRGLAEGLGLRRLNMVSSPTFVLVQEYPGRCPVYHVDLYRLKDPGLELVGLGLEEMLREGVVVIEWADRAGTSLPSSRWEIMLEITGRSSRRLTVRRIG